MNLQEILNWRYATKKYISKKVSTAQINEILEAIRLSPSSAGLQPYKVIVVENEAIKNKLQAASFNNQVSSSSHLLVFAAYEKITAQQIDAYLDLVVEVREVSQESVVEMRNKLKGYFLNLTKEEGFTWAARQTYIALGTGIIAAANLQIDSTPMEGFNPAEFDAILGLQEKGLKSVVLLALGYRDNENDFLANAKKVRIPSSEFIITTKDDVAEVII